MVIIMVLFTSKINIVVKGKLQNFLDDDNIYLWYGMKFVLYVSEFSVSHILQILFQKFGNIY